MPKNKIVKKPNIIGGDKSYIPDKEEGTAMSKIKISGN
ncbi:hypothetical protein ES708_18422 [subsurface metagenome]